MILLQSTLDTWILHAAWFVVVLMAFGAGSIVGALRPRKRSTEVVKRLHELSGCMQGIAQDALKETAPIPHTHVAKVFNKLCTDVVVPLIKYAEHGE